MAGQLEVHTPTLHEKQRTHVVGCQPSDVHYVRANSATSSSSESQICRHIPCSIAVTKAARKLFRTMEDELQQSATINTHADMSTFSSPVGLSHFQLVKCVINVLLHRRTLQPSSIILFCPSKSRSQPILSQSIITRHQTHRNSWSTRPCRCTTKQTALLMLKHMTAAYAHQN